LFPGTGGCGCNEQAGNTNQDDQPEQAIFFRRPEQIITGVFFILEIHGYFTYFQIVANKIDGIYIKMYRLLIIHVDEA